MANRLLSAFPSEVFYRRLQPELEAVSMGPMDDFPAGCIVSLVAIMGDGSMFEVATVGKEGMIGLPRFLETDTAPYRAFTQVPGEPLRLDTDVFRATIGRSGEVVCLLHRYAQWLLNQVAWSAACNELTPSSRGVPVGC